MELFWEFYIWLFIFVAGIWIYIQRRERRQDRQAEIVKVFQADLPQVKRALSEFTEHLNTTAYFANSQLVAWKEKYSDLYNLIASHILEARLDSEGMQAISTFADYFANAESHRSSFNRTFVNSELRTFAGFFDNIEGRKLDDQQRTAIVTDEDNNLVIAGAGSGKTTTIVGKVSYVLGRYNTNPEEILLISFTNKSANTLSSRLQIDGLNAMTFHKLGKEVIATVEGKQPLIYDEAQFRQFIVGTFSSLLKDRSYLKGVTKYFAEYIKPEKSAFDFKTQSEYIQFLKDYNFKPYRRIQSDGRKTWHREVVKSVEECKIANFLLFHNLDYRYELPYEHDTATAKHARWRPDFTVTQNEKTIYIEHLGVKRNGDVPSFFAKKGEEIQVAKDRYWQKIRWVRDQCSKDGSVLIETYSYEMLEDILYEKLKFNLESHGIVVQPKSQEEIWKIISDSARDEAGSFITLFQTFITLMKSNNYSIEAVKLKNRTTSGGLLARRNDVFLELVDPIFKAYERHLSSRGEIDFSDMINRACGYIREERFKRKLRYIIVDEFQDICIGRYQLLKALKEANPFCRLFCVGDDWQSIYRFSGSDLALFKEFEKYFGCSTKSKIETTYRFHNPVLKLSSDFIQKNPNQARKALKSTSLTKSTQYEILYSLSDEDDDTDALKGLLDSLVGIEPNLESKEILLLGRYNNDIKRIKNKGGAFQIQGGDTPTMTYIARSGHRSARLQLRYMTIHKSKGMEADIVVVINCNSGKYGFPSEMADDPILDLLLSESDIYENGEERRLFYVAITRAKERTYLIADRASKSKFIKELEVVGEDKDMNKCPSCVTADLVQRSGSKNGRAWTFYRCSNYRYGCDYKKWINEI
jgi:DNA helicase-4